MPRAVGPYDTCFCWDGPFILPRMTINIVLAAPDDIVIASDGLAMDDDGTVAKIKTHKSIRLNNRLCFVSAGRSWEAKAMLAQLDERAIELSEDCPEDDWEQRGWRTSHGFAEACGILDGAYRSLYEFRKAEEDRILESEFVLCGWDRTPVVLSCSVLEDEKTLDIQRLPIRDGLFSLIQGIPRSHIMAYEVRKALSSVASLENAEEVLVEQIRRAAASDSDFRVNDHILTRRLSDKFRPVWHDPDN